MFIAIIIIVMYNNNNNNNNNSRNIMLSSENSIINYKTNFDQLFIFSVRNIQTVSVFANLALHVI